MYTWQDYTPEKMPYIETWIDDEAKRLTGLDDGWQNFFEYWKNDKDTVLNNNFWCKVISDGDTPFAAIAFSMWDNIINIMEVLVAPDFRGHGMGTRLLKEFTLNGEKIFGHSVEKANAVIFPNNPASQKVFEKAGFAYERSSEDGDAWYYTFEK